jgi:hypothetical protein
MKDSLNTENSVPDPAHVGWADPGLVAVPVGRVEAVQADRVVVAAGAGAMFASRC